MEAHVSAKEMVGVAWSEFLYVVQTPDERRERKRRATFVTLTYLLMLLYQSEGARPRMSRTHVVTFSRRELEHLLSVVIDIGDEWSLEPERAHARFRDSALDDFHLAIPELPP